MVQDFCEITVAICAPRPGDREDIRALVGTTNAAPFLGQPPCCLELFSIEEEEWAARWTLSFGHVTNPDAKPADWDVIRPW